MLFIWLDDERKMPTLNNFEGQMYHAFNYRDCIQAINYAQIVEKEIWIHFDHDLGEQRTGYDVAKYIVECQIPLKYFSIHTMNPVGASNIRQLLTHYGYKEAGK